MNAESSQERLNHLESSLAYLQKDYDSLNQVVLEQATALQQLRDQLDRLVVRFEAAQTAGEPRSLEDERPPHY